MNCLFIAVPFLSSVHLCMYSSLCNCACVCVWTQSIWLYLNPQKQENSYFYHKKKKPQNALFVTGREAYS